ncbi:MAG: protein adenylyltransferase SelO family protein [Brevundimonas sp.]|uniref:protein adenylyltransferase SelO family protein n=2 Tax=Brevundimonas TaxID=41275 RepID=UPI00258BCCD5|nr:protein adenylyltransferase SelO family protein [Brevundimonas sp.]MCV0414490.1 protein adenylyltransferase SelO family protein [Brevundimonas sp.]
MPVSPAYRPEPRFFDLGPDYADAVTAADFPQTILRLRNDRAAAEVGLETLTDAEWIAAFGRFAPLPGQPGPIAMRYHGHQFRTYNPDLGDGRGFLAAQLREMPQAASDRAASDGPSSTNGPQAAALRERGDRPRAMDRPQAASDRVASDRPRLMDLGTKGSGRTPWSRGGDGRLTLKGGVREALAAAMLEALGVPTSRALSLIETGEALERGDEPSPTRSAVLVRLSHSHVRFGTFQRAAYLGRRDQIEALVEHVRALYHPQVAPGDAPGLLRAIVAASARLTARWIAAGFVHGVLNTDNLNATGESFDYGPWRFLPFYDPGFTAAYFDQTGLYAFARQPEAVFWNLTQLAGCLKLVAEVEPLTDALNGFGPAYIRELRAAFLMRLGVLSLGEAADQRLLDATLALLREGGASLRWEPLFFDWFGGFASSARALSGPRARIYQGEAFDAFRFALMEHEPDRIARLEHPMFAARQPEEMLIDEVEAIWSAIDADDDWAPFEAKLARLEAARAAWAFG